MVIPSKGMAALTRFCAPGVQNTATHGRDVDNHLGQSGALQHVHPLSRPLKLAEALTVPSVKLPVQGSMVLSDVRRDLGIIDNRHAERSTVVLQIPLQLKNPQSGSRKDERAETLQREATTVLRHRGAGAPSGRVVRHLPKTVSHSAIFVIFQGAPGMTTHRIDAQT
jgi:capsular polysaccharide biosynthesis protein